MKPRKKANVSSIINRQFDVKNIALVSMLCIYPLLVIPTDLGYFYFPRYIMLGFIAILCLLAIIRERRSKPSFVYIPLLLYLLCILISSITAVNTGTAWLGLFGTQRVPVAGEEDLYTFASTSRFTGFTTIIFCVIMYVTARKTEKRGRLMNVMILCAGVVGLIALLQYFGIDIVPHEEERGGFIAYGTIGNPNFLATYMVFILPAALYKFLKTNGYLWLICSALIYAGLLVSTTRGAWIAGAISFLLMAFYYMKRKECRKGFIITTVALIIVTAALMPANDWYIYKRALSIPTNVTSGLKLEGDAGSGRMEIWKETLKLIPDNWAFGVGPDNLIYSGIYTANGIVDKAHNIYLETAVTMGIPALVFYLAFLSFFIFRRWKTDKGFMFFVMILTYLIQGFFNIDVIMVLPLFWIVLGLSQANYEEERLMTVESSAWTGRNI